MIRQMGLFGDKVKVASAFDATAAAKQKQSGKERAAANKGEVLAEAREIARALARQSPSGITADDVQRELIRRGYPENPLGNAAGSLFRGWNFTGRFKASERVKGHGNLLRVWTLPEEDQKANVMSELENDVMPDAITCPNTPKDQHGDPIEVGGVYVLNKVGQKTARVVVLEDPTTGELLYRRDGKGRKDRPTPINQCDPAASWIRM